MRTHRSTPLLLAGLLALVGGTLPAQEEATLKLVYAVWADSSGAENALNDMDRVMKAQLESSAVVTRDERGNVEIQEKRDEEGGSASTQQASQAIYGVVALLGKPARNETDTVRGYAPGGTNESGVSTADVGRMNEMLDAGGSALILVAPHPPIPELQSSMEGVPGAEVLVVEILPVE